MGERDSYHPALARLVARMMHVFCRLWFRYSFTGMERVPEAPCLFVGNHSGIGIADVMCLLSVGPTYFPGRRFVGMMHDLFISAPVLGPITRACGAVRAHPAAAREALARGHDVVVFPGGNLDSCRPFHLADQVIFGPRRGYVRLALESRAVVVPLVTRGSHYTHLLLPWLGRVLGSPLRAIGLVRDELIPIPLGVPVVLAVAVLVSLHHLLMAALVLAILLLLIPNPVRITTTVLPPIDLW